LCCTVTVEPIYKLHWDFAGVEPLDIEQGVEMTTALIFCHGRRGLAE
jgi:hypothetical protein